MCWSGNFHSSALNWLEVAQLVRRKKAGEGVARSEDEEEKISRRKISVRTRQQEGGCVSYCVCVQVLQLHSGL